MGRKELFACCCNALLTLERTPQCSIPLLFTDNSLPFRKGASVTGVHTWLPSLHFIVQIAMRLVTHSVFVICYYWKPPYKLVLVKTRGLEFRKFAPPRCPTSSTHFHFTTPTHPAELARLLSFACTRVSV